MVEPVDPFQRGEFNRFEAPPWSAPMDDLGLVETVDRFGERVVVTVAHTSDRRLDPCLSQSLRIPDRHVLNAPVRVMHEAAAMNGTPIMKCLLQGIEDKPGMCRPAHPPTDDTAREGVYDKGHIDEALPGGDIGEIRKLLISTES